jgi:Condensation domain
MSEDPRAQFKRWLESGEARLQPVTFPQRELWENSPVPVADPANHICGVIEIKGPITHEQCEAALQRVIDRHEALRTSFLPGKGRPLQMIRTTIPAVLGYRELSAGEDLEAVMQETYRQPFDLLQGPLHRVEMIRRGANDHVLAFSFHHAIADGWSLGVFVQDLCTAYVMGLTGLRKTVAVGMMGLKNSLPPVALTCSDWAAAERVSWQLGGLEQRAVFWKSHLAGATQVWEGRGIAGQLERWVSVIPSELVRGAKALAVSHGTTLFSTLLAVFQLTLSKSTGKNDILVGTPVANRHKDSVRETMGYFAGVVPIRGKVDPSHTFSEHLKSVAETILDCFANAMPFAELATAMGEERVAGRHSIFDVRFALQNHPVPDVVLPRISSKLRMRSTGTARFDLGCEITAEGEKLEIVWLYRNPLLSLAEVRDLDKLYQTTLANTCRASITSTLMTASR